MSKFRARLREKMKEANMMPKLDLPVVIGRLQSLNRFDLDPIFNGEFTELEERKELDGTFVKWDDVEKMINGLKTDNAL